MAGEFRQGGSNIVPLRPSSEVGVHPETTLRGKKVDVFFVVQERGKTVSPGFGKALAKALEIRKQSPTAKIFLASQMSEYYANILREFAASGDAVSKTVRGEEVEGERAYYAGVSEAIRKARLNGIVALDPRTENIGEIDPLKEAEGKIREQALRGYDPDRAPSLQQGLHETWSFVQNRALRQRELSDAIVDKSAAQIATSLADANTNHVVMIVDVPVESAGAIFNAQQGLIEHVANHLRISSKQLEEHVGFNLTRQQDRLDHEYTPIETAARDLLYNDQLSRRRKKFTPELPQEKLLLSILLSDIYFLDERGKGEGIAKEDRNQLVKALRIILDEFTLAESRNILLDYAAVYPKETSRELKRKIAKLDANRQLVHTLLPQIESLQAKGVSKRPDNDPEKQELISLMRLAREVGLFGGPDPEAERIRIARTEEKFAERVEERVAMIDNRIELHLSAMEARVAAASGAEETQAKREYNRLLWAYKTLDRSSRTISIARQAVISGEKRAERLTFYKED